MWLTGEGNWQLSDHYFVIVCAGNAREHCSSHLSSVVMRRLSKDEVSLQHSSVRHTHDMQHRHTHEKRALTNWVVIREKKRREECLLWCNVSANTVFSFITLTTNLSNIRPMIKKNTTSWKTDMWPKINKLFKVINASKLTANG